MPAAPGSIRTRKRSTVDAQLLKGVLGVLLLRLLEGREAYGYELVGELRTLGIVDISDGSVYPALARLERRGYLSSRLVPSPTGPARKYYALSASGQRELGEQMVAWRDLVAAVDRLLGTSPGHREVQQT
jgi:PadR family transcriptional regulator